MAFLGALYAGIVPVAVNTLLTADDYAYMLAHSRAQALFVSGALLPTMRAGAGAGRARRGARRSCRACRSARCRDARSISAQWRRSAAAARGARGHRRRRHRVLAVFLRVHGPAEGSRAYARQPATGPRELYGKPVLGIGEDDVVFSAAKLFFAYGLGNALTFPLSVGATTLLMAERATPQAVFQRLTQHKPTIFYGVPTLYAAMMASPELPPRADVALRRCISAGEALPREVGERFAARFGCEILDGIGSTEMLHIFLSNQPGEVRYGTTGKPVPGLRHRTARRGRPAGRRRRDRRPLHSRPFGGAHVLGEPRAHARDVPGRVDEERRQVHARRRRLLHVCGPQRRHAQGQRPVRVAVRSRGRADAPRGRARGGGRRQDR